MKQDEKLSILIILASNGRGGVEKRFINYLVYLSEIKVPLIEYTFIVNDCILLESEKAILKKSLTINLKTYKTRFDFFGNNFSRLLHKIFFSLRILTLRQKSQFDIVHFITIMSFNFIHLFPKSNKIASLYSGTPLYLRIKPSLIKSLKKFKITYDCLSPSIKSQSVKLLNIDKSYFNVSPCSFINYTNTSCDINQKKNQITFLAAFRAQKGTALLIELIKNLDKINHDYILNIIGSGADKDVLKKIVEEYNQTKRVNIFYSNNPIKHLKKSKIFLSLQQYENYPSQSLLEAMACKNYIIATNVGLTHKIVSETNGVLIPETGEDLVKALCDIINNGESFSKTMELNRKKVLKNHNVELFHKYLHELHLGNTSKTKR